MRGRIDRVLEYFTAEPLRVSAWLRLPLIGLIVVLVSIADIDPWFPAAYWAVLAAYIVSALVWVVIAVRGHVWPWAAPVATAVDILAVLALCVAYGPPAADLLPVLFLLPISVAFEDRPGVTAILGIFAAAGYLGVWIFYSTRDDALGMPNEAYLYFGLFLWLAAATTALCFVLTRRSARVNALLDVRRRLVAEAMRLTNGTTGRWPSTCTTVRCRISSPPVWNSTKCVNAIPNQHSTWCIRHCRTPRRVALDGDRATPSGAGTTGTDPSRARTIASVRTRISHRGRPRGRR